MSETYVEGNFLGLPESAGPVDLVVLPLPYELTTSYGQGTADGPAACIAASAQVEVFDAALNEDLPASHSIHTAPAWEGNGPTLASQLDELGSYLSPWCTGECLSPRPWRRTRYSAPVHVGHAPPPCSRRRSRQRLTVVQIDAHADLRAELDGEAVFTCLRCCSVAGYGRRTVAPSGCSGVRQGRSGVDSKLTNASRHFSQKTHKHPTTGGATWEQWIDLLSGLSGPIHLTIDIDGLDASLVPATGTPVPGGLSFWQAIQTIEAVFDAPEAVGHQCRCQRNSNQQSFSTHRIHSGHVGDKNCSKPSQRPVKKDAGKP